MHDLDYHYLRTVGNEHYQQLLADAELWRQLRRASPSEQSGDRVKRLSLAWRRVVAAVRRVASTPGAIRRSRQMFQKNHGVSRQQG